MKNSLFQSTSILIAIITNLIIPSTIVYSQEFQTNFGTAHNNVFSKVIDAGSDYFILGQDQPSTGSSLHATVTLVDAFGFHQWTLRVNIPSIWNDATLTPTGDLMLVGNTLPFDDTNQSLIGLVTKTGGGNFTWLRSYSVPGREGNYRIIRNPVPENPLFPYYIGGARFDPIGSPTWDDITLLNLDESGVFNWKKRFPSTEDDEFIRNLDVLSNGDLILAGNLATNGVIIQIDHSGTLVNGVSPEALPFSYADIFPNSAGGYYAVGTALGTNDSYLFKHDSNLGLIWESKISGLTSIVHVWEDSNGDIYVTGRGNFNGVNRGVLVRLEEVANFPNVQWIKFLDNGETSYTGGSSALLNSNQIAFVDGRDPTTGGFGNTDAFLSVSNIDFETCISEEGVIFADNSPLIYNSPFVPEIVVFTSTNGTNISGTKIVWPQEFICIEPCEADFIITALNNCGHYQVTNTSTGQLPLTYMWCNGSTTENLDVQLPCGQHTFCLTVTDAIGCTSSLSQTITVSDNVPPIARCALPFGMILDSNCEAIITPGMINNGSIDNCQIQSISVSPSVLVGCGVFPVTLTVTDWCGNTSTCVTNVQTTESIPPVITCPSNVVVTATTATPCSALVNGLSWISATDNCGTPFVEYVVTGATSNFGQNDASGLTYNEGVSTVIYTATDDCGNTSSCDFNVIVNCKDSCYCGTFTDMAFRFERGPGMPVVCGGSPVTLRCPPAGYNYALSGKFQCQGTGCPDAPLNAQLEQPDGTIISLGSQLANPYFGISFLNLNLQQFGVYTLTLTGQCGNQVCTCVIRFIMDPPCVDVCPCEPSDIHAFLLAGFQGASQLHSPLSCKVCFTPNAYGECESVNWWLDSVAGTPIGIGTPGDQSFCYTFPGPGTYTVYMVISRFNDDGSHCHTLTIPQTVVVTCGIVDVCSSTLFDNPTFAEGALAGGLLSGGRSRGWSAHAGEPEIIEGSEGSTDAWSVLLYGNLDTAAILTQLEPICLNEIEGMVRVKIAVNDSAPGGIFAGKAMKPRPCDKVQVQLFQGDQFELNRCNGIDCYTLGKVNMQDFHYNVWNEIFIPYNLNGWVSLDSCGEFPGIEVRPVIYVTNALSNDQGGIDSYSFVEVDNFCISGTIVGINDPSELENLRIYPNPNQTEFFLDLMEPAAHDWDIHIISLAGQIENAMKAEPGLSQQKINVSHLVPGMYFLHVIKEGRIISVNKFIKQ